MKSSPRTSSRTFLPLLILIANSIAPSATKVRTDFTIWAENDTAANGPYEGMYNDSLGSDNVMDLMNWYDNTDMAGSPIDIGSTSEVTLSWMQNMPLPGATADGYVDVPTVTTAANQVAGDYLGTLTIKAVEHWPTL